MKGRIFFAILLIGTCLCGCGDTVQRSNNGASPDATDEMTEQRTEMVEAETSEEADATPDRTSESELQSESEQTTFEEEENLEEVIAEIEPTQDAELIAMEEAILQMLLALPEEKQESALTQDKLDNSTVQWFNGTYGVMLLQNNMDYTLIGGGTPDKNAESVQRLLSRDWGVDDRASAIDNIYWLLESGHRESYEQTVAEFEYLGLFEIPLEEYLTVFEEVALESEIDFEEIRAYFTNIYNAHELCGDAGVKAWDYGRVMQMCGSYYVAGYFTLEESMDISLAMAELLRYEYASWEEYMNSYLCGYDYWRAEDPQEQGTGSYWRHYYYNEMMKEEDCPYTKYAWDMEFVVNWR